MNMLTDTFALASFSRPGVDVHLYIKSILKTNYKCVAGNFSAESLSAFSQFLLILLCSGHFGATAFGQWA